ncbi:MAG: hypothetical protein PVG65_01780 [Candidatus Thorarchaeota archaeon]
MASDPVFHPLVGTLPLEDGSIDVVLSSLEWVRTFSNFDKNRNELHFGYEKDPEKRDEYYHFTQNSVMGVLIFVLLTIRWII